MAKRYAEHPRRVLESFLSLEECKELEFIHKSCSTVGYRPNVFSTTLSHLIATNSAHLIMPFVPIRERLKETAEEVFGCEYELFIEFTGLISWCRGASIGWHSDDNRPYLKQRDFAVVCYLNSHGKDFDGGLFHFQDGEPATVVPMIGDVIMYTADSKNIHSVDEVIEGERLTLTLWFTRDSAHDEDAKLVSRLSNYLPHNSNGLHYKCLPSLASSNMYWFSPDQAANQDSGFDVCVGRMHVLGFDIHTVQDVGNSLDASELLMNPLQIANEEQLFSQEFINILHALQVVQFHRWKASDMETCKTVADAGKMTMVISDSYYKRIHTLRSVFVRDQRLLDATFGGSNCDDKEKRSINWLTFSAATTAWEEYTGKLLKLMLSCLPYWIAHQSIYSVQFG